MWDPESHVEEPLNPRRPGLTSLAGTPKPLTAFQVSGFGLGCAGVGSQA